MGKNISAVYDPLSVEGKWYEFWEKEGLFHAEPNSGKKPYCIVIPPPNVTGQLHMGHAIDNALQDILIRFHRMRGYSALWMPGTDHAGIATQAKVEESLRSEGLSRYDLGRDKFIEKVWQWKAEYGGRITNQLRRLGASCDWERERFTMDEGCSHAVREVFVNLYEKGLIYRSNRITNWCVNCNTALSDIEVEHEDESGFLWHVRYPLKDNPDTFITVATTRPETILGDTGVAVHPEDGRYKDLVGKELVLPIVGRIIPIVADEYVDMSFGTGAVKVTPAHDPNDFEMGVRHDLPQIVVIGKNGHMLPEAGEFSGMDRYECRKALVAKLKELGNLVKVEEHNHAVGHCQRCGTVVEPLVSLQWFVKMQPLVQEPIKAVADGRTRFVPERFAKTYSFWMENIRDWCISRQIWWGHRIPAWYCKSCGETMVSRTDINICPHCGGEAVQDEDVLDTWFSSALWPFSTLGWPDKTEELEYYYPTSVLVTGYDIIFFWVARMMVMGLEFMKEVPFRDVFIHGLVRDSQGRKMSKSLGNGIDPLEVVDKYGADSLRFTLVTGNTPGNDMRFYWERAESSRNFANKIWNAARFALMNLEDYDPSAQMAEEALSDKWIISRFNATAIEVTRLMERYELGEASRLLYEFIWNELCDWYIELVKPRLYDRDSVKERARAQKVLADVLSGAMQLMHPIMPFITEEIWQTLPHEGRSIMTAKWFEGDATLVDEETEQLMQSIMDTIKAIRNMRAEMNVPPGKKSDVILHLTDEKLLRPMTANSDYIKRLAAAENVDISVATADKPDNAVAAVVQGIEIYMPIKGLIDIEKEVERLGKELASLEKETGRLSGKLGNQGFLDKAPADVVEKEKEKLQAAEEKILSIKERVGYLKSI